MSGSEDAGAAGSSGSGFAILLREPSRNPQAQASTEPPFNSHMLDKSKAPKIGATLLCYIPNISEDWQNDRLKP